ncbi:MAG TPA: hypothetical protein VJC16_06875 [Candidatus Nanoarchaeia archaeon]|nr:hypothetical protein [Candidatus Nanoarchaeia archaeon]
MDGALRAGGCIIPAGKREGEKTSFLVCGVGREGVGGVEVLSADDAEPLTSSR